MSPRAAKKKSGSIADTIAAAGAAVSEGLGDAKNAVVKKRRDLKRRALAPLDKAQDESKQAATAERKGRALARKVERQADKTQAAVAKEASAARSTISQEVAAAKKAMAKKAPAKQAATKE